MEGDIPSSMFIPSSDMVDDWAEDDATSSNSAVEQTDVGQCWRPRGAGVCVTAALPFLGGVPEHEAGDEGRLGVVLPNSAEGRLGSAEDLSPSLRAALAVARP